MFSTSAQIKYFILSFVLVGQFFYKYKNLLLGPADYIISCFGIQSFGSQKNNKNNNKKTNQNKKYNFTKKANKGNVKNTRTERKSKKSKKKL